MAVSFCYGTIGSGKTYDCVAQVVDELQDGHKIATINMNLNLPQLQHVLVCRGMGAGEARIRVGKVEKVWSTAQFRQLRNVKLKADEAKFWWPQSQYRKIDFEDILTAAMSRKRGLDIHIIDQLEKGVNQNIRDLALDSWLARPLTFLSDWLKLARKLGLGVPPCAFFYERFEDAMGKTSRRNDGTASAGNKRVRWLNPMIAACYNTLEEVSSPMLEELRDRSRQEYLLQILKGETKPTALCPICNGQREIELVCYWIEDEHGRRIHREPYDAEVLRRNYFAWHEVGECPGPCMGRGYYYDPQHPDFAEAERLAETLGKFAGKARRAAA